MLFRSPVASVIKIYTLKILDRYDYRRTGNKKNEDEATIEKVEV